MKQINYLLIASELTGDSTIQFFDTPQQALTAYQNIVNPLIDICNKHNHNTDIDEIISPPLNTSINTQGYRFNTGYIPELDAIIGNNNVYYEYGTKTVNNDVTHYVAYLSQWVDESTLYLRSHTNALNKYTQLIQQSINNAKTQNIFIDINNPQTFINNDGDTICNQSSTPTQQDTHFNYCDVPYTLRLSIIS